ncbi:hypothetical protein BD779DRAFT_1785429 [Infundibulicybe gibba]|nr:hypothetical protein BD779DRAFT_1785429 [Infundibulicybe gibba]
MTGHGGITRKHAVPVARRLIRPRPKRERKHLSNPRRHPGHSQLPPSLLGTVIRCGHHQSRGRNWSTINHKRLKRRHEIKVKIRGQTASRRKRRSPSSKGGNDGINSKNPSQSPRADCTRGKHACISEAIVSAGSSDYRGGQSGCALCTIGVREGEMESKRSMGFRGVENAGRKEQGSNSAKSSAAAGASAMAMAATENPNPIPSREFHQKPSVREAARVNLGAAHQGRGCVKKTRFMPAIVVDSGRDRVRAALASERRVYSGGDTDLDSSVFSAGNDPDLDPTPARRYTGQQYLDGVGHIPGDDTHHTVVTTTTTPAGSALATPSSHTAVAWECAGGLGAIFLGQRDKTSAACEAKR